MKFNPKVTGGLAWAGLILILAVPSADMLTKPQGGSANSVTSDMDAIRTASVDATAAPKAPRSVAAEEDRFAAGSDAYPSYIVDVPEGAPKKPATTFKLTAPGAQPTRSATDVASVTAEPEAAPVPHALPAWRIAEFTRTPAVPAGTTKPSIGPVAPVTSAPATSVAAAPTVTVPSTSTPAATESAPLILDEELIARREAAVARVLDVEPARDAFVDGDELEEWDSGSLADYLDRKGLLSDGENQQASADSDDDEGFWLDERDDDDRRLVRRVERRNFFFF